MTFDEYQELVSVIDQYEPDVIATFDRLVEPLVDALEGDFERCHSWGSIWRAYDHKFDEVDVDVLRAMLSLTGGVKL